MLPFHPKLAALQLSHSMKSNAIKDTISSDSLTILNSKCKEDQAYDGDSESCSSTTLSYYSQSYNALVTNDGRRSKHDEPTGLSPNIWYTSETVAVPMTEEPRGYVEKQNSRIPPLPNRTGSLKYSCNDSDPYPEEKQKTLLAGILACFSFAVTLTSLVLTHQRLPDREHYGPLPDIVLDNLLPFDWALDLSEYIILLSTNTAIMILLFHKHRFIVFRRLFLILAVLYIYRAFTMFVTVLPIASRTYHCDPKLDAISFLEVTRRVLKLMSGFGLSINGRHVYCGDFIYSGHTVTLVLCYLTVAEYTSEKFWFLQWIYWFLAALGIIFLEFAHGHYTIDVIIAYYITTRVFWTYHTLANNIELKINTSTNYYSREWWFRVFQYFEKNVGARVPNDYDWPFWWSRRLLEEGK